MAIAYWKNSTVYPITKCDRICKKEPYIKPHKEYKHADYTFKLTKFKPVLLV